MDHIVQRIQNLAPFNIYAVKEDGSVEPWWEVTGAILAELVISEDRLVQQVEANAAQIANWGRLAAQAKRVWEVEERGYRVWRDKQVLLLVKPPDDEKEAKAWKKPTEKAIEATYRQAPGYATWCVRVERAEEAYNAAMAVLDGYRAQRDALKGFAMRGAAGAEPRMHV